MVLFLCLDFGVLEPKETQLDRILKNLTLIRLVFLRSLPRCCQVEPEEQIPAESASQCLEWPSPDLL